MTAATSPGRRARPGPPGRGRRRLGAVLLAVAATVAMAHQPDPDPGPQRHELVMVVPPARLAAHAAYTGLLGAGPGVVGRL